MDIAVDPLEGTNLCATGAANAIAVLAASEKGGLLHAPDIYMEKLVVGPSSKGKVDINAPVEDNLKAIAEALDREVNDLVVIVLDRPRHEKLIADIRKAGARIRLIGDGDLSAGITAAVVGTGVHAVMGTGRRARGRPHRGRHALPERRDPGASSCSRSPRTASACKKMGIDRPGASVYRTEDLAPGKNVIFAAAGVTDGSLLKGVRFFGDGIAHPLPGHDDGPAPGALHRHHPRQGRPGRQDPVLTVPEHVPSRRRSAKPSSATAVCVMPFGPSSTITVARARPGIPDGNAARDALRRREIRSSRVPSMSYSTIPHFALDMRLRLC